MGVFTFLCRSSLGGWTAKQLNGELEWSAGSNFELQRKLVQAVLSADSSGAVQSSFAYLTPSSAVFKVIVGGALIGGGGAAPGVAPATEDKKEPVAEEKNEKKEIKHRRAYNLETMLSKRKIPLHDLLGYEPEKENLGKCEQFFSELMQVPRVESKLRALSFKNQLPSKVSNLRNRLNVIDSAANQIRGSAKLRVVVQLLFSLGYTLSQGRPVRFGLDSLLKLSKIRSLKKNMTLMHYLCKDIAYKQPELLDFWNDLPDMERASKIQLSILAKKKQAISKGLEEVEQELSMSENDGTVSEHFCKVLKEFHWFAKGEVSGLNLLYSEVGRNVDAAIVCFGEDPSRFPFDHVISGLLNFVRKFKQAHNENLMQLAGH